VFPLAAVLAMVRVPRTPLRLCAHLMAPPARQGLNTWASPHSNAWRKNSVGGSGADLVMDGISLGPRHLVPAQTGLGVESGRC
jgi:hypothetical protein